MSRIQARPGASGCSISKEDFIKSFEQIPQVKVTSAIEVKNKFDDASQILSNGSEDWSKRILHLKNIRGLIINGEKFVDRHQMVQYILQLVNCLELSVKDLRSQILREAAITCSLIVQKYGIEVHSIGEDILPSAMAQVSVSAKIMATSAATLTEFIVECIQTRQIFTILSSFSTSKDKSQRRQLVVLLEIIIEKWGEKIKKQVLRQLCELIKSGICDADSETRAAGRKAFAKLDEVYPEQADELFQELDHSKQKVLRPDAASSSASVNSDRGIPIRSKLSAGLKGNISAKFLAQRSASAIDPKAATKFISVSRLVRPISTKAMTRVDTSPTAKQPNNGNGASLRSPRLKSRTSSMNSQPDSDETSPFRKHFPTAGEYGRIRSPISLSVDEPGRSRMTNQRLILSEFEDDDEFLLHIPKPVEKTDEMRDDVSITLKSCFSSSSAEKKEGVRMLLSVVSNPNLNKLELKNVGNCLNRLLSDVSNSSVLDAYIIFIQTHSSRLSDWLRLALAKLFSKKGSEVLPNTRKQIEYTLIAILECFDSHLQLVTVCELMCDPIHLMIPKARVALLEYIIDLIEHYTEPGSLINIKEVKLMIRKMFAWLVDPRQSQLLTPFIEKVICSLFCLNSADFYALFSEFENDQKQWAHQVLAKNGLQNGISYTQPNQPTNNKNDTNSFNLPPMSLAKEKGPKSLGSLNSSSSINPILTHLEQQSTSRLMERVNLNSTINLTPDTFEQAQTIQELLNKMTMEEDVEEQNNAITTIYMMICDGTITLWEQCYAKLLLNLFEILSSSKSEANKKVALRVLAKMCVAQAAKLFDSTEIAVCKVLDAAVESKDPITSLAVEDCLRTLATHLPISKIVNIAKVILEQEPLDDERAALVLKMVTRLFEELQSDEVENILDDIAPSVIKAYKATSSAVRKGVIYCLVSMVNRLGEKKMDVYFKKMSKSMINLINVYVTRAISSSLPRL